MAPARRLLRAARPGDVRADRDHASGGHADPRHGLRRRGAHVPLLRRRHAADAWPSFCYPDEQYFRAVDLSGAVAGGRTSALGVLHRWYGAGKGRPASAPGLLVQLSLWYDDGRHVVFGSDGSWRERPAEWLPSPQRNSDACDFVEWVDAREHPRGGPHRLRRHGLAAGHRRRSGRRGVVHRDVRPAHPDHGARRLAGLHVHARLRTGPRSVVFDFGAVYPARPRVQLTSGQVGRDGGHARRVPARPRRRGLDHPRDAGDEPLLLLRDARRAAELRGVLLPRLPLPPGRRRAGRRSGAGQVHALARHAAMPEVPPATFTTGDAGLDAVWALNARSCLYCCHEQFVDTPTREKAQFLWDAANESEAVMRAYGEQNLSGRGCATSPAGRPGSGPTAGSTSSTPTASEPGTSPPSPSATRSGCGGTTSRPATETPWRPSPRATSMVGD